MLSDKRKVSSTWLKQQRFFFVRPDRIQLLKAAKRKPIENWSDDELVSQCYMLFSATFENYVNLICSTAYELLQSPQILELFPRVTPASPANHRHPQQAERQARMMPRMPRCR
ncbi:GH21786 [Drosophila grimshawi]|uniref:GH21786 n=1 Tax=Drosophila grimshawi TaxID=7222 RepID=B4J6Y1_DROGR|nr:GH21786 [Drosophila grimshawi]